MKNFNNVLIYLSLGFVVWYLWDSGLYHTPEIYNVKLLAWSFILLILGHILYVKAWESMLSEQFVLDRQIIYESESLTIFNKYIPGKIWVVLGPVSYLKRYYNISTKQIINYSFNLQVIIIWTGLLFGLFFIGSFNNLLMTAYAIMFITLSLLVFTSYVHKFVEKIIFLILSKVIKLPKIEIKFNIISIVWILLMWLVWSFAFYLFVLSTIQIDQNINIVVGLVFPIASVIGIVTILSPGGIGVRESMMIVLLLELNMNLELSTQVSIDSRLWFIVFEILIFFTSLFSIIFRKVTDEY